MIVLFGYDLWHFNISWVSQSMQAIIRTSVLGVRLAVVLLVVYWALMFAGTHIPRLPVLFKITHIDKAQHFIAYTGLAFLLAWAIPGSRKKTAVRMFFTFVCCLGYAIFDEWTQGFFGRKPDFYDGLADVVGASLGILIYCLARRNIVNRFDAKSLKTRPSPTIVNSDSDPTRHKQAA